MQGNPISEIPKRPIVIKYGLITAAMLIVYFLIMSSSGLLRYSGLRFFNYALLAAGLSFAFTEAKRKMRNHNITYLPGLGMGFMMVLVTAIIFSVFVFIYAQVINTSFLDMIWPGLSYSNGKAYAIGIYVFGETLAFGLLLDIILIQVFKRGDPSEEDLSE
jgi:hypothetical protein